MKKKHLTILVNSKNTIFGLGDFLRILSFVPNLKFNKYFWVSDKELFPMIEHSDIIKSFIPINSFKANKILDNSGLIFDLNLKETKYKNSFSLTKFIYRTKNIKIGSVNIIDKLAKKFGVKNVKLFHNQEIKKKKNKSVIYFNWVVPQDWSIKQYPRKKWLLLEKKIKSTFPNYKIIWQKRRDNIKKLFSDIRRSKIVISTIGLGSHVGMLFNKELLLLCGPTFFDEIKLYQKAKIIKTKKFCSVHKKKLNIKFKNCNCMDGLDNEMIFNELKKVV